MIKFTTHNLKKVQSLLEEQQYVVRYEKGNFQSGFCILESKNIVLINKFFDTEGRINSMLDILSSIEINESGFSEKSLKFYQQLFKDN